MHASSVALSGMPTGKKYMGWWGAMGGPKQKGIYTYTISGNQQNAMQGALRQYAFHGYRRFMKHLPYWGPPLAAGYAIIAWAKKRNGYLNSKAGHLEMGEHGDE